MEEIYLSQHSKVHIGLSLLSDCLLLFTVQQGEYRSQSFTLTILILHFISHVLKVIHLFINTDNYSYFEIIILLV